MDRSNNRLMVVDDDRMHVDFLSRRLESRGYVVVRALRGAEALDYLKTGRVDLMLLDLQMPDMTGLEILRRIRLEYNSTELPVIMVTATSDTNTVLSAASLGANDFLGKPLDMARVLARISWHLSSQRDRAKIAVVAEQHKAGGGSKIE